MRAHEKRVRSQTSVASSPMTFLYVFFKSRDVFIRSPHSQNRWDLRSPGSKSSSAGGTGRSMVGSYIPDLTKARIKHPHVFLVYPDLSQLSLRIFHGSSMDFPWIFWIPLPLAYPKSTCCSPGWSPWCKKTLSWSRSFPCSVVIPAFLLLQLLQYFWLVQFFFGVFGW